MKQREGKRQTKERQTELEDNNENVNAKERKKSAGVWRREGWGEGGGRKGGNERARGDVKPAELRK